MEISYFFKNFVETSQFSINLVDKYIIILILINEQFIDNDTFVILTEFDVK